MNNLETLTLIVHPDPLLFAAIHTLSHRTSLHLFIASAVAPNVVATALEEASFKALTVTIVVECTWPDDGRSFARQRRPPGSRFATARRAGEV